VAVAPPRQEVKASSKYVRTSPRKARLVVEHIRGRSVPEARTVLAFTPRAVARDIEKLLKAAVANAEANHGLIGDDLLVSAAYVDEGPVLKRWRARARGRVGRIKKRTCHITIGLAPPAGEAIPALIERPAPVTLTEEPEPIVVDDETGAVVEGEAPVEDEAPAEEKPKRKRAPRAKAEAAPDAEAATEAEAKPKRTRAAKPKAEAETAEPETAEPEAEAKPKTTRKKKTETTESDEGGDS